MMANLINDIHTCKDANSSQIRNFHCMMLIYQVFSQEMTKGSIDELQEGIAK